jgi:hypothetical protein
MDERTVQRQREIEAAVADVRAIEARDGVTRESLDFPPPQSGSKRNSCLYRVSEDSDHRFALYTNSSLGNYGTPARVKGEFVVRQGTGVAFMPDDLHSIHISGPLNNFHMYGLALEQLFHREYYKADERTWKVFPPHSDIREARSRL